jgi:hypothetical protein
MKEFLGTPASLVLHALAAGAGAGYLAAYENHWVRILCSALYTFAVVGTGHLAHASHKRPEPDRTAALRCALMSAMIIIAEHRRERGELD